MEENKRMLLCYGRLALAVMERVFKCCCGEAAMGVNYEL